LPQDAARIDRHQCGVGMGWQHGRAASGAGAVLLATGGDAVAVWYPQRVRYEPWEVLAMSKPGQANREQMIRQLIAVRAYEMWESQGRPHGHDAAHWRQAEQDIMACLADSATADAPAASFGRAPPGLSRNNR
jgi:hypothetical protein